MDFLSRISPDDFHEAIEDGLMGQGVEFNELIGLEGNVVDLTINMFAQVRSRYRSSRLIMMNFNTDSLQTVCLSGLGIMHIT